MPYQLCFKDTPCHVALFVFYLSSPPVVLPLPLESSLMTLPVSPFSHSQIWASLTHQSICSLWTWILLLSCFIRTSGHLSFQQSAFCPSFYSCNKLSFYPHGLSFPLSSESTLRFLAPFPFPDFNLSLNYISSPEGTLSQNINIYEPWPNLSISVTYRSYSSLISHPFCNISSSLYLHCDSIQVSPPCSIEVSLPPFRLTKEGKHLLQTRFSFLEEVGGDGFRYSYHSQNILGKS